MNDTPRNPDEIKYGVATANCPNCGAALHVLTNEMYEIVEGIGGVDAALQFATQVGELAPSPDGSRIAVADASGVYTCPHCRKPSQLLGLPPLEH